MRLKNKTVIITGGGTGIGKAIALACSQEGAYVAICGRRKEALESVVKQIKQQGGEAIYTVADVSLSEQVENVVGDTLLRFGKIDVLVNNAGIASAGSVTSTTVEEWDRVFSIDVKGIFVMSQAVLPHMVSQDEGKIITIASIAGLVGFPHSAAYCAAKGAVVNLTRQMALDFAKNNITVNAIAPGFIATDMTKDYLESASFKKEVLMKTPLNKIGKPEDIAYLAVYLASKESDFMTGQVISLDGGWTIQ